MKMSAPGRMHPAPAEPRFTLPPPMSIVAQATPWIEGRDFVMATKGLRERLAYLIKPEVLHSRWLEWDDRVAIRDRGAEIRALRLMMMPDERPDFPVSLYELEAVRHLGLPVEFAAIEHPSPWAGRLVSLDLNERDGGRASIPTSACFRGVRRLSCVTSTVGVHPDAFPALESLELQIARQRTVEQRVGSGRLRHVHLVGVRSLDEVARIVPGGMTHLGLGRSPLASLAGLGRFAGLRKVTVKDLPKLSTLAWIAELPELESLELHYCPRLESEQPLLEHPGLRTVHVVACRRLKLTAWKNRTTRP